MVEYNQENISTGRFILKNLTKKDEMLLVRYTFPSNMLVSIPKEVWSYTEEEKGGPANLTEPFISGALNKFEQFCKA